MGTADPKTDEELLETARSAAEGDLRAFEELVRRHQQKIVANCRYITRAPNDAEDLAQEVFLKAFFGMRKFEGRSTVRTWLQRIKVNHCLNQVKKRSGKTFVDVDDLEASPPSQLTVEPRAEREVSAGDERRRIGAILDSMSDTLRIPLILCDMDQLSYQEIADSLGIGLSAVKMRIKRAREEFQQKFRMMGEDDVAGVPVGDS